MNVDLKTSFQSFLRLDSLEDQKKEEILERHKLGGVFKEFYPKAYKRYWVINTNHINFLREECTLLGLKGTLLKGCHLIQCYYDEIGMRFMGDIDFLVSPEDFDLWGEKLESIGFREVREEKWAANDFKKVLLREKNGMEIVIELHSRLFFQEGKEIYWESESLINENLRGLKSEDLFIHLCGHLVYQHTFHSLNWLYDIALLVQKEELNWEKVFLKAKKARVLKSCHLVLAVLQNHFGVIQKKVRFWDYLILKFLITPSFLMNPYKNKLKYSLVKIVVKDSFQDAFSYTHGWLKNALKSRKSAKST